MDHLVLMSMLLLRFHLLVSYLLRLVLDLHYSMFMHYSNMYLLLSLHPLLLHILLHLLLLFLFYYMLLLLNMLAQLFIHNFILKIHTALFIIMYHFHSL